MMKKLNGAVGWIGVVFALLTLVVSGTLAYGTNRSGILLNRAAINQLMKMQEKVDRTDRLVMKLAIRAGIPLD